MPFRSLSAGYPTYKEKIRKRHGGREEGEFSDYVVAKMVTAVGRSLRFCRVDDDYAVGKMVTAVGRCLPFCGVTTPVLPLEKELRRCVGPYVVVDSNGDQRSWSLILPSHQSLGLQVMPENLLM